MSHKELHNVIEGDESVSINRTTEGKTEIKYKEKVE